jgi:hypothetical protein
VTSGASPPEPASGRSGPGRAADAGDTLRMAWFLLTWPDCRARWPDSAGSAPGNGGVTLDNPDCRAM